LIRKAQLDNYEYSKDREKTFLLYLGTTITKVKTNIKPKLNLKSELTHQAEQFANLLEDKEIMCLVTQTNYNTQRGKYLRAIRYQKKPVDNFTRESIYFIYIIIIMTVVVFFVLYPFIYVGQPFKTMLVLFLDLLATSIPITLPTALSVGINFAQRRLLKVGIHSILPSNILSGGRATTIMLDSNKVLSKNYEVSSIVVGVKNNSIGNTYSSLSQFLDVGSLTHTESFLAEPQKKRIEVNKLV
jgi:magnesium-transporting ATPase (P-type)